MRKVFSYAKSHIYEIHAIIVATIVVVLMSFIKVPIKKLIVKEVDRRLERHPRHSERREIIIKRCNILLIILTMCLSVLVFAFLAVLSPFIVFSFPSAAMSGVFALCEYAFLDQIFYDIPE